MKNGLSDIDNEWLNNVEKLKGTDSNDDGIWTGDGEATADLTQIYGQNNDTPMRGGYVDNNKIFDYFDILRYLAILDQDHDYKDDGNMFTVDPHKPVNRGNKSI